MRFRKRHKMIDNHDNIERTKLDSGHIKLESFDKVMHSNQDFNYFIIYDNKRLPQDKSTLFTCRSSTFTTMTSNLSTCCHLYKKLFYPSTYSNKSNCNKIIITKSQLSHSRPTFRLLNNSSSLPNNLVITTLLYICTWFLLVSLFSQDFSNFFNLNNNTFQSVSCQTRNSNNRYNNQQFNPFQFQAPPPQQQQASQTSPIQSNPFSISNLNNTFTIPDIIKQQGGLIRDKNVTLSKEYNPILITKDIIIKKDAKLTIESGTEISFAKNKGIIVYGSLVILGTQFDRVKLNILKSSQSATVNFRSHNNNPISQQQVRLVDGDLPSEGRVQIKFNDKWHSLCTNSKNLTAADIKVICQQVGYQDGYWYKWFPKRNETLYRIMSKSFHCQGTESAISQCKRWNRIRSGGGICDYHSDIGIRCSKTLVFNSPDKGASYDYWRGIEFVQSETIEEYIMDGQMKQKVSKSSLQHVYISDAGLNEVGNATAAIRVYGLPPKLNHIDIRNSIYGIMIEDADDAIKMSNIKLVNNMGYPLFVNTSSGRVSMDNMHVENNGGDGIRIVRHEKIVVGTQLDFCKSVTQGSTESFPVILSHEQPFFTKPGVAKEVCCQEFLSNNKLTVHFPVLRSTPNNLLPETEANRRLTIPAGVNIGQDANLVIYDDYQYQPFKLRISNGTRAQSIVSRSGMLKICYEPANYRTVLFTIEVVVNKDNAYSGIANDIEISNSFINNNQGRGIWIDNSRSGSYITNTTVLNHNYLSGIHVENGTGQVIIQGAKISNNTGNGILINLAGGYYHIDNSTITDNSQKGILIEYDKRPELVPFNHTMHLGYSLISGNGENGLYIGNVCRSDAFWNISMNSFINNGEDAIYFQSCLPNDKSLLNFKHNTSRLLYRDSAEQLALSNQNVYQELFITHNVFLENIRRAINMAPVFFVKSFIRHNLFREHQLAVIYISNQEFPTFDSFNTTQAPTNIRISSNRFYSNQGRYVANIGVQEDNPKHSLVFTKNFLEGNEISEPYSDLKPRSRVSAVVAVSSSNTKVIRNRFDNPKSEFDLGSHLDTHSKVINATANFWGRNLDASSVYKRIFDRKNRYNLAQVEFLQYLLSPEDLEYATDLSFDRERDKITTFKNGTKIGGEVRGYEDLNTDTYIVQDDIFIRPGGHLILHPGTVLKFNDGVGMMVQGRLDALGTGSSQILMTSSMSSNRFMQKITMTTTTTPAPVANPWVSYQSGGFSDDDNLDLEKFNSKTKRNASSTFIRSARVLNKRQTLQSSSSSSSQNVRLSHVTMGRLEVQIDGIWGSVCDYGFDINDAAVVCQQLGMILNKDDWLLEKFQYSKNDQQQLSMMSTNSLMTNLRCDSSLDTDITKCKAEISLKGEFDGMCNSEVGIRCFPPSWSGVRIGMGAETSTLEHVTIQRAGMLDYATFSLKPALQIDFYKHWISSLVVRSNSDSGLGIMWNDVIGRHFNELSLVDSKFVNNERHGIELRTKGLTINRCLIGNNRQNGLDYNPTFSFAELDDLISWIYTPKNVDRIIPITFPTNDKQFYVPPSEDIYKFFVLQKNPQPSESIETFTIMTNQDQMLSIDLLYPIHPDSTESLNMTTGFYPKSPFWNFRTNMTSFPMVIPGYKLHFNYSAGNKPKGNIVMYIRSRYNGGDMKLLNKFIPSHLVKSTIDLTADNINSKLINSMVITNSNITKNGIGIRLRHPNRFYGQQGYHIRYSNETTNITNNLFEGNHFSPIFVGADDYEIFSSFEVNLNKTHTLDIIPPSEIYYNILNNKISKNKDGIRQFSRDLRQSYNVFHWTINGTMFEFNKGGGINIVLPYYWNYDANLSHTFDLHDNNFIKNSQFELILDGHYTLFNMTRSIFKDNKCRNGLIEIIGMEKRMNIRHNVIEYNACNRLVLVDIQSHADKLGAIPSYFEYNIIRSNRRANSSYNQVLNNFKYPRLLPKLDPQASNYALNLQGIQSMNITRNLFVNPDLRFELIAGIMMDSNEKPINAIENYWGSVMQSEIGDKIFDFDDWNSYALVEINPYLTQESLSSAIIVSQFNHKPTLFSQNNIGLSIGGRLTKSLVLPYRKEPYLVESDLTIMPNVKLTLEKGVVMEFMPNVGILVLGDLIAVGSREKPIQMRPALTTADIMPIYQYLVPSKMKPNMIQSNLNDQVAYDQNYIFKHLQMVYPIDLGSVRLCKNEICNDGSHIQENNVEEPNLRQEVLRSSNSSWKIDGFLEVFNMTTLKWVPVCDPLFTEHTAKVVCKQLGYSHLTIFKRGRRYTMEQEQISSISHWPESIQCEGTEANISSCLLAPNGYTNQTAACNRESNQFIYVYCQDFPEPATSSLQQQLFLNQQHSKTTNDHLHHWAGIRFACPTSSSSYLQQDLRDSYNLINQPQQGIKNSRLQYIVIDKAGLLHRRRSAAVQVFQCNVQIEYTVISNSAHHGLEVITSQGNQNYHQLRVRNNMGLGINYLPFTGSSSGSKLNPYLPLKRIDLIGDIFGPIDICGSNKEIQIDDRIFLYYRYSSKPVDCIKIISSKFHIKHIGIRMLQFDLFNSTAFSPLPDSLKIYDGNIFDRDSKLIADLGVTDRHRLERPELKFYETTDSAITIRLHASGSSQYHGFIAEVVTTPISYNIQRDTFNNITFSEITNNKLGAISVTSAGESSPNLIIRNNRIESNGLHLFGNFTSCVSAIYMELQNCPKMRVTNNLIKLNQGGMVMKSYSHSAMGAIEAHIENNVFEENQNTNTIALIGPKTDPYQAVKVIRNFFTRNYSPHLSNIVLSRIVANFSYNIVSGNTGKHQIEVIGFDKLPLSHQSFDNNWIYNNTATLERDKSTIFGNSAGQQYHMNYIVNPDNFFELSTMNWSRYDVKQFHIPRDDEIIHLVSGDGSSRDLMRKTVESVPITIIDTKKLDLYQASMNAKYNWWGFNTTHAIHGRIRDRYQHEELIKVDFIPYLETNRSVLNGICSGGWQKVGSSCLVYIGSRMTYNEAREFCEKEKATLPILGGNHYEFTSFIRNQERGDYDSKIDRVWIRSFDVSREACPALNDFRTKNYDCFDKYPFLCEKDPIVVVSLLSWHRETAGIVAFILTGITLILALCCSICWSYKSRQRQKERIERKNTIYASFRSNRGPYSSSNNNSLSDLFLHRQMYNPTEKSSITDLSLSTQLTQPSNDNSNLVKLDPAYSSTKDSSKQRLKPSKTSTYTGQSKPLRYSGYSQTQTSLNSDYVSPSPQGSLTQQTTDYVDLQRQQEMYEKQQRIEEEQRKQLEEREQLIFRLQEQQRLLEEQNRINQQQLLEQQQQYNKTITPSPSYRDLNQHKPRSQGSSRTPSYSGSQFEEVMVNPMPIVGPVYSQINHALATAAAISSNKPSSNITSSFKPQPPPPYINKQQNGFHQKQFQPQQQVYANFQVTDIDSSNSSAPTYYSNQFEGYVESSNPSILDTISNTYYNDKGLEKQASNDQVSYVLTEKTSTIDKISKTTSVTNSKTNLVSMNPRGMSDESDDFIMYDKMIKNYRDNNLSNKALSETASSQARYLVETSFDIESPDQQENFRPQATSANVVGEKQTSLYSSSQRLSPISHSSHLELDSKQGSRVYLETSFE